MLAAAALSGCAHAPALTQAQAEATWESEAQDVGYAEARFAPLWSSGAPLATPDLNKSAGSAIPPYHL